MQAIQISQFLSSPTFSSLTPSTLERAAPKADEYLIRITHVSLQHVDLLYAQGRHQNNHPKRGHVHPPFILGLDFAGIVVSAPSAQTHDDLHSGDRVMGSKLGAFAEFICVKPSQIRKVPASISNEVAAALVGAAVSYGAVVHMAEVRKGETVLVTGANGGLGVVACQVAKALGAKVIGLVSSLDKARRLRSLLDIDVIVSGRAWENEVKAVGGGGVDVVIDNVGLVESSLRCLNFNGRIILVGFAGRNGIMEEVAMNKILLKGARIIGYVGISMRLLSPFIRAEYTLAIRRTR